MYVRNVFLRVAIGVVALFVIFIAIHLTITNGFSLNSQPSAIEQDTPIPTPTPGVPGITCPHSPVTIAENTICTFTDTTEAPDGKSVVADLWSIPDCSGPSVAVTLIISGAYNFGMSNQNLRVLATGVKSDGTGFNQENTLLIDQGGKVWQHDNREGDWVISGLRHKSLLTIKFTGVKGFTAIGQLQLC